VFFSIRESDDAPRERPVQNETLHGAQSDKPDLPLIAQDFDGHPHPTARLTTHKLCGKLYTAFILIIPKVLSISYHLHRQSPFFDGHWHLSINHSSSWPV